MIFQDTFEEMCKDAAWDLRDGALSVGYMDLNSRTSYFFNGDHVFPAASIVKVPILLEYLRQKDAGLLNPDEEVAVRQEDIVGGAGVLLEMHRGIRVTLQDLAHLMIVISDNTASNMLLDRVGMDNVNEFMRSVGMKDTVVGRKFMIDPNTKFAMNFVTVKDMILLYDKLYHREILTDKACSEAIEIMSRQQYREKIPLLLPTDLKIAHKTGEITGVRHDCAIVFHEKAPYALCLLTEKLPDVVYGDRMLAELSLNVHTEVDDLSRREMTV